MEWLPKTCANKKRLLGEKPQIYSHSAHELISCLQFPCNSSVTCIAGHQSL